MIHCRTEADAKAVKAAVEARLLRCKLEAHPDKTRLVYCRDSLRRKDHANIQFDFLGYTLATRNRAVRPRDDRSRMSREAHVRFWESAGVQFPRATQPIDQPPRFCASLLFSAV